MMTISWFSMAVSRTPNLSNEYWITFYADHSELANASSKGLQAFKDITNSPLCRMNESSSALAAS